MFRRFTWVWHNNQFFRVLGILGVAVIWWVIEPSESSLFPSLRAVCVDLWQLAKAGILLDDVTHSLTRVAIGVAFAVLGGTLLGVLPRIWGRLGMMLSGVLELLRPVPPIAWTPVVIIWLGVGNMPAYALVMLGAFFPIWLGVQQAVGEVRQEHLWAARSLGASWRMLLLNVMLPSALPYFLHGLRLGLGMGWFCVVAAEMMGVQQGLGQGLLLFSLNLEMAKVFGYIIIIGFLGMLMTEVVRAVEQRLVWWHHSVHSSNV